MSGFWLAMQDVVLYRGREGQLGFLARRLAGLGTLLFLALHILDTATVYFFPYLYADAIALYRSTPFMLGEIVLVAAVIYHGVNGVQIILHDTFPHWWTKTDERAAFWRVSGLAVVLWLPPAYIMGRALYLNNICRCAPPAVPPVNLWLALVSVLTVSAVALAVLVWGKSFAAPYPAQTLKPARGLQPRRNLESWAWLLMRWSGALLVPLAWGHVLLQDALVGVHAINLDYVAMRWASLGWRAYDAALLVFAFGHGLNGLRGILNEYLRDSRWRRLATGLELAAGAAILVVGVIAVIGGVRQ
jgi:succinate dehydrogenase hydrophobic anchor subunit